MSEHPECFCVLCRNDRVIAEKDAALAAAQQRIAELTAQRKADSDAWTSLAMGITAERDEYHGLLHEAESERDEALATAEQLRAALAALKHYGGAHMEDQGVCVQCALDERLNDEDADWPCWYTRIMSTATPATPPPGRELEQAVIAAAREQDRLAQIRDNALDYDDIPWPALETAQDKLHGALAALDAAQQAAPGGGA